MAAGEVRVSDLGGEILVSDGGEVLTSVEGGLPFSFSFVSGFSISFIPTFSFSIVEVVQSLFQIAKWRTRAIKTNGTNKFVPEPL